jgi:hypothetical protein
MTELMKGQTLINEKMICDLPASVNCGDSECPCVVRKLVFRRGGNAYPFLASTPCITCGHYGFEHADCLHSPSSTDHCEHEEFGIHCECRDFEPGNVKRIKETGLRYVDEEEDVAEESPTHPKNPNEWE